MAARKKAEQTPDVDEAPVAEVEDGFIGVRTDPTPLEDYTIPGMVKAAAAAEAAAEE